MIIEQNSTTDSSMITRAIYNFTSNSLKVEFKSGQVYEYEGVDPSIYEDFCKADSQGKFFNEKIKNNYNHSQLIKS